MLCFAAAAARNKEGQDERLEERTSAWGGNSAWFVLVAATAAAAAAVAVTRKKKKHCQKMLEVTPHLRQFGSLQPDYHVRAGLLGPSQGRGNVRENSGGVCVEHIWRDTASTRPARDGTISQRAGR